MTGDEKYEVNRFLSGLGSWVDEAASQSGDVLEAKAELDRAYFRYKERYLEQARKYQQLVFTEMEEDDSYTSFRAEAVDSGWKPEIVDLTRQYLLDTYFEQLQHQLPRPAYKGAPLGRRNYFKPLR
jgi:hypothetical protein